MYQANELSYYPNKSPMASSERNSYPWVLSKDGSTYVITNKIIKKLIKIGNCKTLDFPCLDRADCPIGICSYNIPSDAFREKVKEVYGFSLSKKLEALLE